MNEDFSKFSNGIKVLMDGSILNAMIGLVVLIGISWLLYVIAKSYVMPRVREFIDYLNPDLSKAVEAPLIKLTNRLAWLFPYLLCLVLVRWLVPGDFIINSGIYKVLYIYLYFTIALIFTSLLSIACIIYNMQSYAKNVPIKGVVQILKLLVFIIFVVLSVAELMDTTPLYLLTSLGALTAVLLLIFKDTILGLVAGVQIATHRVVAHGDWIEMEKFGADGEVLEVGLHTVKVQNWDKTISCIPTTSLVHDSFKNWRGMKESGGRRIKRAILVDIHEVVLLDEQQKAGQIAQFDENFATFCKQTSSASTNIGLFREYCEFYLRSHSMVNQQMTLMARQLQPNEFGISIELYCFCVDKDWVAYEKVQAQIVEHLVAALQLFELRAYQRPTNPKMN